MSRPRRSCSGPATARAISVSISPATSRRKLAAAGVEALAVLPHDTFADPDRFFSYRRVTLAGGSDYGRLLSAIALAS